MKFIKRIMSMLLALMIMLSVCSSGFTPVVTVAASVGLKDIVLEPVKRPEVDFYCTEITRVAKAVDSVEPGDTIVKATPSGVPELTGSYVELAYAGETPVKTTVTFVAPVGVLVNGISCNNENVVLSDMKYSNGKYVVTVESGTAIKNEDGTYNPLVFTVDYTDDKGLSYQQRCVSHVESIATGGAFAGAYNEVYSNWGMGNIYRVHTTAFMRLLGKGVYYELPEKIETNAEDPYRSYGIYNAATDTFTENVSAGYNTSIMTEDKNSKPSGNVDQTVDFFVTGTTPAHVYLDSSEATKISDANIRLNADTGALSDRNNSDPYVTLADAWVFSGSVTEAQPEEFENDVTAQSAIGLDFPEKQDYGVTQYSGNTPMETLLPKTGQHSNIFSATLDGSVANLTDGSSYTVITRYHSYMWVDDGPLKKFNITSAATIPLSMTFHVVDKGGLREEIDYVMNSDPEDPLLYNATGKGANPQAWYYNSGFVAFQKAYTEALAVLGNPKAPQSEIDEKTKNLHDAYDDLAVKGADYKEVNELTKIADNILKNSSCYSEDHISLIIEAKSMVKKNYSIFYQSAVDTMAYNLSFAIDRAKPLAANYDKIENLENEFNAIYQPDYNSDSVQAVKDAFAKVDYSLTALEQKQVDAWEEEIRTAMNNLVPLLADFSELVETLNEAKEIERKYYINGSVLDEPVEKAEEAVADNKSNQWFLSRQEEVDALTENLREAIDGLVLKSLNKLDLKAAIDAEIPGELQHYDQNVLGEYQALVEDGTEMYNDSSLTIYDQDKVDAMTEAITMKYAELMSMYFPPLVNLSELNEAIASADEFDRSLYCDDDAMKELDDAVEAGIGICEENLIENEENMLRVAEATERIKNAINGINLHKEKVIFENNSEPDCTEVASYDKIVCCELCGKELSRNTIITEALGHAPAGEVREKEIPATPGEEGSYEAVIYCSRCGEELSRDFVIVPALGHTPAEAVKENIIEATCTEKGSYELVVYCSCCAEKVELSREKVEVPAAGHINDEVKEENKVDTTCISNGSYDAVIYCMVCNEELMRETITVPTLGHRNDVAKEENRVEATCTTSGSYDMVVRCRVCGEIMSTETFEIPVIPHSYDAVVTAPTCTDEGYTTYTCSVCGDSYEDDYVDATGHSYGDWDVVDATCTEDGLKTKTCGCGDVVSEEIPAKGHTEGEWKVTKEAGVGVAGEETLYCAVCDAVMETKEIPAISAYFIAEEGTTTIIDDETGFIYGLEQGISDLEEFVEYEGGTVEYVKTAEGFGTGTVVNFIVNGEVLYTYTIVILGDITGDGVVDTFDSTKLAEVVNGDIELEDGSAEAFAADIENNDEVADTYDLTTLYAVVNGDIELSQVK